MGGGDPKHVVNNADFIPAFAVEETLGIVTGDRLKFAEGVRSVSRYYTLTFGRSDGSWAWTGSWARLWLFLWLDYSKHSTSWATSMRCCTSAQDSAECTAFIAWKSPWPWLLSCVVVPGWWNELASSPQSAEHLPKTKSKSNQIKWSASNNEALQIICSYKFLLYAFSRNTDGNMNATRKRAGYFLWPIHEVRFYFSIQWINRFPQCLTPVGLRVKQCYLFLQYKKMWAHRWEDCFNSWPNKVELPWIKTNTSSESLRHNKALGLGGMGAGTFLNHSPYIPLMNVNVTTLKHRANYFSNHCTMAHTADIYLPACILVLKERPTERNNVQMISAILHCSLLVDFLYVLLLSNGSR